MPDILESNPDLKEYAAFIQAARKYCQMGYPVQEAVTKAILDFRYTEVMGPFLDENASEVLNMLTTEWNTTDFGKVQRAEGRAEGHAEGHAEGRITNAVQQILKLLNKGISVTEVLDYACCPEGMEQFCLEQALTLLHSQKSDL